jgi:TRAP transporter TAXI family solute receptor
MVILTLLWAVLIVLTAPRSLPAFPHGSHSIGAGPVTGTYYAASSAIAKVFNRKSADYGIRLATVESQGSLANVEAVLRGETVFGIAQADVLQRAAQGQGQWEGRPQHGLRAVLTLQTETVTVVAARDSGITSVADLRGKRVNIGGPGSSDQEYAAALLEPAGLSRADVVLFEHPTRLAPDLLQQGRIDAYICTVGHPNLALLELSTGKRKARLVPLDLRFIEQATAANPLLRPAVIPVDFYPGLDGRGPVPTVGGRAVLFTRADMAHDTVSRLVSDVLANFALLRRQHPVLQPLTPPDVCRATVIPAHPAAEHACREAGLTP